MLLCQSHQFELDQVLLNLALDNAPECLDRVQLWAVRRQEHEHEVEILRHLSDILGVVRWMVVQYDEHLLVGVLKLVAHHGQKLHNMFLVRRRSLHEDRHLEA